MLLLLLLLLLLLPLEFASTITPQMCHPHSHTLHPLLYHAQLVQASVSCVQQTISAAPSSSSSSSGARPKASRSLHNTRYEPS